MCARACTPSRVQFLGTPWTLARQAPLSMEFPRQEYMVPREIKIVDSESTRRVVPRAWGGDGELVFKGDRASVWEDEDVLEEGGGGGCSYYVYYEGACVSKRPVDVCVCVCETHGCVYVCETHVYVCICVTVFLCVCVRETHVCMCVCA